MKKVKEKDFLSDCHVYFVGFSKEATERYKSLVIQSGATRYPEFNNRVTHVIVREDNEKIRRFVHESTCLLISSKGVEQDSEQIFFSTSSRVGTLVEDLL